jgi:YD repeat-containing protein
MRFSPPCCPNRTCPSKAGGCFRWLRRGWYQRACDRRRVQRFQCRECRRYFSEQTFRLDFRLKLPELHLVLLRDFVSKITQRQSARMLGCRRKTIAHRMDLLGRHCRDFHAMMLARAGAAGGVRGLFQLDELETYEERRRLQPVTVPVLVETSSAFIVSVATGALPARGSLRPAEKRMKLELEKARGVRRSESKQAVAKVLEQLETALPANGPVDVSSDSKATYPKLLAQRFGARVRHVRMPSNRKTAVFDPLFPVNHTLAMARDALSRLVRQTWAASKRRSWLERHLWIWVAWRNYCRTRTNAVEETPAMALKLCQSRFSVQSLTAWRVA